MDARRHGARDVIADHAAQNERGGSGEETLPSAVPKEEIRLPHLATLTSPLQHHHSPRLTAPDPRHRDFFASSLLRSSQAPPLPQPLPPPPERRAGTAAVEHRSSDSQDLPSSVLAGAFPPTRQYVSGAHRTQPDDSSVRHHHMHHHHHHHHDQSTTRPRAFTRPTSVAERQYSHKSSAAETSSSPRQDAGHWIASDQHYARSDGYEMHGRSGNEHERVAGLPFSIRSKSPTWSAAKAAQASASTQDTSQIGSGREHSGGRHPHEGSDGGASSSGPWPAHQSRTRARWTASPYERMSFDLRLETFRQLWDIFLTARRYSDGARLSAPSTAGPRPLPSIAEGDLETLSTHLQYEVDILFDNDPRAAEHLANSARSLQMQFHERKRLAAKTSAEQEQDALRRSHLFPPALQNEREDMLGQRMYSRPGREPHHPSLDSQSEGSVQISPFRLERPPPTTFYPPPYQSASLAYSSSVRSQSPQPSLQFEQPFGNMAHGAYGYPRPYTSSASPGTWFNTPVTTSSPSAPPVANVPRRVRKRHDEVDQSCLCCSAHETPEWRKGPTGPRTLCNACGLLYAKQVRKRDAENQSRGKRGKSGRIGGSASSTHDDMTPEEQQAALMELSMAVQVRANQSPHPRRASAQPNEDDDDGGGRGPGNSSASVGGRGSSAGDGRRGSISGASGV